MSSSASSPARSTSRWRIVRWSALVAVLVVAALLAADVAAGFVVGGRIDVIPHPHLGSPIALSSGSAPAAAPILRQPQGSG